MKAILTAENLIAELKRFPGKALLTVRNKETGEYKNITGVYRIDDWPETPKVYQAVIEIIIGGK